MPSSGVTTFTVTRDEIIGSALRLLQVYGTGDTIPSGDITNCAQALNIVTKAWGALGLNLWVNVDLTVTMSSGVASYQIGPSATGTGALITPRPMRIIDSFVRLAGVDTLVQQISRYDYNILSDKSTATAAVPTQFWYDPQIPNGSLVVYPTPSGTSVIHLIAQRQLFDFTNATDNPDVPQEWFQLLKWSLAEEIALEYECKPSVVTSVASRAQTLRSELIALTHHAMVSPAGQPGNDEPNTKVES